MSLFNFNSRGHFYLAGRGHYYLALTHLAARLDKLFPGAYCGKDTASKPKDFDQEKAIPIAIYSAKLAEILDEFNREHKHRGQGMYGKTPAQLYQELYEAEPLKEWPRPTVEDLRLCLLEQRTLTLNKKDASVRFKIDGYGEVRYWSETLAHLPLAARHKKYAIFHNPDAPELPVILYCEGRLIGEAQRQDMISNKLQAAQFCKDKNAFKAPIKEDFKAIKQSGAAGLPALGAPMLPINTVVIEKPSTPAIAPKPAKLITLPDGRLMVPETGEIIEGGKPAKKESEPDAVSAETQAKF